MNFFASQPPKAVTPLPKDWNEVAEEKKVAPLRPLRVPIPQHLLQGRASNMKGRGRSTNPVGRKGKGRFRQPGWRNIPAGTVADYGLKAWQLAKHLATLVNVEDKIFDVDGSAGTIVTNTATVVNLSNIAQGTDYFNRTGNSILGQKMEFRAYAFGNPATALHIMRVLLVVDHENHGVDPVIGDVLTAGTSPMVQPINPTAGNRFSILYDELVTLSNVPGLATSGTSTTYVGDTAVLPTLNRKWNSHIKYDAPAGADASNSENALFLMAISTDGTNGPNFRYAFRLHFTDN